MTKFTRRKVLAGAAAAAAMPVIKVYAQDVQERTIRWGHLNNTDHPVSFGVQKFAEILAREERRQAQDPRSSRRRDSATRCSSSRQLRGGTQEMFSASTTSLATVVKEFGLLDFPFIVGTIEQADALVDGSLRQGDARDAAREGLDRSGLLGARLSQRHQQQASDREGRRFRGIEAPCRFPIRSISRPSRPSRRTRCR